MEYEIKIASFFGVAHPPPTPSPLPAHCRGCPYFLPTPTNITTAVGAAANLTCGVRMLGDRQVSWIRRHDLHVLTTDSFTYTTDSRFRAVHVKTSPYWVLSVSSPTVSDSGIYECQVSAQPKIYKRFNLQVVVPKATIYGSRAVFMKAGSDLNITCVITGVSSQAAPVTWYHVNPTSDNVVDVLPKTMFADVTKIMFADVNKIMFADVTKIMFADVNKRMSEHVNKIMLADVAYKMFTNV
nr:uncharacterized protein LOC128692286 [Cherax quadricarinatus]